MDGHRARVFGSARGLAQIAPLALHAGLAKRREPLEGKAALRSRRDAAGDLRRFDGDGAGAAHRVEQRPVGLAALPAGRRQHGRGERLLERCLALVFTPAALEQRLAGGVDIERGVALGQVQQQRQVGAARVDARARAGGLAHHVAHAVLDAQRGEIEALERRALRRHIDLDGLRGRHPVGPAHAAGERVEIVFAAVGRLGDAPQHALREAAAEVERHRFVCAAGQLDAAAARARGRARQQPRHFAGKQAFDARGARQEQG